MKRENLFYLLILLTILISRFAIMIWPEIDIKVFGMIIHHFWFGIVLVIGGFIIPKSAHYPKLLLYGIGAGLIIDQLIFIMLGAGKDKEYWSIYSLLGTLIIVSIIYPFRMKLINFLALNRKDRTKFSFQHNFT
ncbi:MAG: hypothetical protein Q8Q31_00610 [Nanoarchaeota archaeon]|nr:hypothetical protein [Nanoarchaeota archaeon]